MVITRIKAIYHNDCTELYIPQWLCWWMLFVPALGLIFFILNKFSFWANFDSTFRKIRFNTYNEATQFIDILQIEKNKKKSEKFAKKIKCVKHIKYPKNKKNEIW